MVGTTTATITSSSNKSFLIHNFTIALTHGGEVLELWVGEPEPELPERVPLVHPARELGRVEREADLGGQPVEVLRGRGRVHRRLERVRRWWWMMGGIIIGHDVEFYDTLEIHVEEMRLEEDGMWVIVLVSARVLRLRMSLNCFARGLLRVNVRKGPPFTVRSSCTSGSTTQCSK